MKVNRRNILGVIIAGSTCMAAPRVFAAPILAGRPALLDQALAALDAQTGRDIKRDMLGIVDFNRHSREKRFQVVDISNGRILSTYLVAHGKGSDPGNTGWVGYLSDRPGSNASSQGSYVTGQVYYGKHGRSRRLHGLDPSNSHAFGRGIVIHGADYVSPGLIGRIGKIGRSLGCFAVEQGVREEVLDVLESGRLLFAAG